MKKNTLLYILLFFLIIVNGFFLYNYLGRPEANRGNEPKDPMVFIAEQLKFDSDQLQKMENLNKRHHQNMRRINDDLKELKDGLFNRLSDVSINKKDVDSITALIGQKEKEKDTEAFYHFRSIQELCNEKQKEKFNKIINDALRKGGGDRPPQDGRDRNGPPSPPNRGGHEGPPPPPNH